MEWVSIELPVFTTALLALMGYGATRFIARTDRQDDALSVQTQALALVVQRHDTLKDEVVRLGHRVTQTEKGVSALRDTTTRLATLVEITSK